MKENFVQIVFVVDESGSMSHISSEVISGFNKFIEDQKALKEGDMNVSLYTFNNDVTKVFGNKNILEVDGLSDKTYRPSGMTALCDGIGKAINETGKELSDMDESERPSKVLIVVMTDGEENSSKEYRASQIRNMIKNQEEKYNWSFVYLGTDLKDAREAQNLGFVNSGFHTSGNTRCAYASMSNLTANYRSSTCDSYTADKALLKTMDCMTEEYEKEKGVKVTNRS